MRTVRKERVKGIRKEDLMASVRYAIFSSHGRTQMSIYKTTTKLLWKLELFDVQQSYSKFFGSYFLPNVLVPKMFDKSTKNG